MKHRIADLLDIPRLQIALDTLYSSSKIPSAIIDNDGNIHTGSGWQDICTKFHRVHPEARKRCIESDLQISRHIHEADQSIIYKCPHGLVDAATPIIIEGEHLGNVFTGQLFLEEPDLDYFRSQARIYGFDEGSYIDAVKKVPIISEQAMRDNLAFLAQFTEILAEMGLKHKREVEAEQQIRESEERFRNIFRENSSVMLLIDPHSGRIEDANPAAAAFYGYSEDALRTMTIGRINTLSETEIAAERARALHKERNHFVFPHRLANGEIRTVEVHSSPVEVGGRFLLFSIIRDITERKRAEEALRESERRYRGLFEHMQEGFAFCKMIFENGDPVDFIYLSVNESFETLTGLKSVEGKRVSEVIPGIRASDPALFDIYGRVAATGNPEKFEMFVEALQQWFSVSVYCPEQGYFAAAFDVITDRKRSEETARRETSLRNILLDNLPCIALVQKKHTREIVACNDLARKYGAAVGKVCYDALAVPGTPCPFCRAPEVWETGEGKQVEVEYMEKFWQGIWVPFSDDLYVHYIFDITDRKRAETEKEKLHGQLQHAMKMEAIGRMAGGIAHDFNNLLTAIIGNVSLALGKLSPSDPVAGVLMEADKAADRAASLVKQLLAFSRKQIIEPKVLNLNDLIADLHVMLVRLIREDIGIEILPGKNLGAVKIDAGQFQQVLVNLVVNARDAMPDGGKIVIETSNAELDDGYCSMHPYVKPGRFVMMAVSDSGHGMSDKVKAHVFEPFFTTKAKGSGTGLGLATTYGAVKQAGGSIEVYSEIGMGTTFKIFLPRVAGEASKLVRDDSPQMPLGGTETVLLVEDEDVVRDLCARVLDELGYRVLQASNGKEAIAISEDHGGRIDILMTDVVMPAMNGGELATQLILRHPEMRVLFTSGYTENVIVHHGVLDDGVSFLGKPYSPSALAKKIREVLDKVL